MTLLYSMHDREGNNAVPMDGFGLDLIELKSNSSPVDYRGINPNINWLVRVDWSHHGEGTFPVGSDVQDYITKAFDFILKSQGFYGIVLGNEPNHPQEGGFAPDHVAWLFSTLRNGIKSVNSSIKMFTPAIAPYRYDNGKAWNQYLTEMLTNLQHQGGADGTTIHAYARSMEPGEATSEVTMGSPLDGLHYSFRTYLDALAAIPGHYSTLPCFLTEFNVIPDWEDRNTGIVKAVYKEIANHNAQSDQKVHCLTLFRWTHYEGQQWGLENKPQVLQDYYEAINEGAGVTEEEIFIPSVGTGSPSPAPSPDRYIDPEAISYGITIEEAEVEAGDEYWFAYDVQFLNKQESQGNRNFYFDVKDEAGNRIVGKEIYVWGGWGDTEFKTEEKKGEEYACSTPFTPGKNQFNGKVDDGLASDLVLGAGMGEDTPSGFNPGEHTSVGVKYIKKIKAGVSKPAPVEEKPVVGLAHPVENPRLRVITQFFGENPDDYKHFKVDGVSLRGHNGLDFGTPVGSVVDAVDDGTVVENANDPGGYGNYIKLRHSWGESLYAHLSQTLASVGEAVKKGENIGLSGNSGNSTGPHLHFAMRVNPFNRADGWGGFTDPSNYFGGAPAPEKPKEEAPTNLKEIFKKVGKEVGLEWELLASQSWAESSFDPEQVGGGLMQVTDETWYEWAPQVGAKDIDDPLDNVRVGAYYLKYLMNYYEGNIYQAVLAYNHGMGNVDRKVATSEATRKYVDKVFHGRDLLKALGEK